MKITLDISADRIANLMCSAIESGDPVTTASKGGWCAGIYFKTQKTEAPATWYSEPKLYESKGFQIMVVEVNETNGRKTPHIIRRKDLIAGLIVMATKFPKWFAMIMNDNTDAPCADVFLQCVVFGKEKYA